MENYSIDTLYDEGFINGEVYYLCDENGISCLDDAIRLFNEPNPPKYITALRDVYSELLERQSQYSSVDWLGWKDDCVVLAEPFFGNIRDYINQFNSFVVFIKYIQTQDWLFGQYSCNSAFKDEINRYWQSRQPETIDAQDAPWRDVCKQLLSTFTPFVQKTLSSLIDLYPNAESFMSDLQSPTYADEVIKIKSFGKSRKQLVADLISQFIYYLNALKTEGESIPHEDNVPLLNEHKLASLFNNSIEDLSVRAYNAIRVAKSDFGSFSEFFKWVLSADFEPLRLRNVGRKTVVELREWRHNIQDYLTRNQFLNNQNEDTTDSQTHDLICNLKSEVESGAPIENSILQNETELETLFNHSLGFLSVRARNAISASKIEHLSYSAFFKWVLSTDFNPIQLNNVGRKTVVELKEWREYILDCFANNQCTNNLDKGNMAGRSLSNENTFFDDLFHFFDSLTCSRKSLAYYLAENSIANGFAGIAKAVHLSRERVRQLIPEVLESIARYLKRKRRSHNYSKEEFYQLIEQCNHSLDKDFVIWAGSQVSSEMATIGSYIEHISKGGLFMMVDAQLALEFDFNQYVKKLDALANKKYYEETKISIEDIVLDCFIGNAKFELLPAITRVCRTILYDHYPYHLSESEIIIPANAYYSIRQRVEDILTKEGEALTVNQIRKKLAETGAVFSGSDNQLVSLIRKSSMIVSYGIPCRFGLLIWGKPEDDTYGTIRDDAISLLLKHTPHIMVERDLLSALLAIYPQSSQRSIVSNLLADAKQRFGIYKKGNERYVGLTKDNYDSSFVMLGKNETNKTTSSSQKKLSWQGAFDSVKRVLSTHDWTALDDLQRKWLVANWKKAQSGSLKEWQATQIIELIETSKKR